MHRTAVPSKPGQALSAVPAERVGPRAGAQWWHTRRAGQALVVACLLFPLALFAIKTLNDRATILDQAERDVENTARIFEQHAHNTFETYQLVASLLDEHVRGLSWDEIESSQHLHDYLAELVRDYSQIRGLWLLDRDGAARATNFPIGPGMPNFAGRDYFVTLKNKDEGTVIGPRIRAWITQGLDLLNVARRRTTPDGIFDGVVVVTALPETFETFWQKASPSGFAAIFRGDGRVLARYPKPPGDILQLRAGDDLIRLSQTFGHGLRYRVSPVDGIERVQAFRKISGYPVFIVYGLSVEQVLQPWRRVFLRDGSLFAIADLGLVLLAFRVNRRARREEIALAIRTDELRGETHKLAKAEAELAKVLRGTLERQEADRARIARDLHDGLGQQLAVLHLGLDGVSRSADDVEAVRQQVKRLKDTATEVSYQIGRIAWELRPVALDELGLRTAIQTYIETMSTHCDLEFDLHIALGDQRLDPAVEIALYRAVQEGVTNVVKHADATRVCITLGLAAHEVRLVIEDNGKGFAEKDNDTPGSASGGLGLLGMRERMSLVGGNLEVENAPGGGATLLILVPA
jgi:signal transduction histidine kinase